MAPPAKESRDRYGERTTCAALRCFKQNGTSFSGAFAQVMTGNRRNRVAQHPGKDVPQFAPNFTVYLLPPDAVCLYSEDRKFFLHGELYCALASAIGNGGRSFRELFASSSGSFRPTRSKRRSRGSSTAVTGPDIVRLHRHSCRLLGELGPAVGNGAERTFRNAA